MDELTKRILEIQKRLIELNDLSVNEEREFSEGENKEWEDLTKEYDDVKEKIEAIKAKEERKNYIDGVGNYVKQPVNVPHKNPVSQPAGEFRSFGEFLQTIRYRPHDPRLGDPIELESEKRDLSMGVGPSGGFLVPEQFSQVMLKVDPQEAIMRPRATVIPAGSPPDSAITMPALDQSGAKGVYSGVTVSWLEEGGEKPPVEPTFREIKIAPHEVAAITIITDKLMRNTAAAEAVVTKLLRQAIIAAEDVAFLNGTGVGQPVGIINHASAIAINRATAATVAYADVAGMYPRVKFGGKLIWIGSPTILPQLMVMVDAGNHLIWQPNAREGAPGTLLGLPLLYNERNPVLGARGDLILADLSYYMIKDGFGIAMSASEHVHFQTNRTMIKAFWNVDGQPWLTTPLTLEDGVTTVSPFVVLDVPAA